MIRPAKYLWIIVLSIVVFLIAFCHQTMQAEKELKKLKGKVVFSVGRDDLYVLDLSSQEVTKIELRKFDIFFPSYPCWLPNGEQIVLSNYRDNRGVITVYDLTKKSVREYPEIKLDCSFISLSPNGKVIAFLGKPIGSGQDSYKLYTLSLDNNKLTSITDISVGPYKPSWSPDGSKITFTSVDNNIYVLSDGKAELIISNGVGPAWSPTGNKILYRSTYFVYLFDLDNKLKKSVITNLGFNDVRDYAWSPDAKYIIYKKLTESYSPLVVKALSDNTKIILRKFGNIKGLCWKY